MESDFPSSLLSLENPLKRASNDYCQTFKPSNGTQEDDLACPGRVCDVSFLCPILSICRPSLLRVEAPPLVTLETVKSRISSPSGLVILESTAQTYLMLDMPQSGDGVQGQIRFDDRQAAGSGTPLIRSPHPGGKKRKKKVEHTR